MTKPMTPEEVTGLAVRVAKTLARKWNLSQGYREVLGAAWIGVHRAAAKNVPASMLKTAAVRNVIDSFRKERVSGVYKDRKRSPKFSVTAESDCLWDSAGGLPVQSACSPPRPKDVLSEWLSLFHLRKEESISNRVILYLVAVEEWELKEVVEFLGLNYTSTQTKLWRMKARMKERLK